MMAEQDFFPGVPDVTIEAPDHAFEDTCLVLKWRHIGDRWEALVSHEVDGRVTTEWLPALVLSPTRSTDPS
jgi:hypothetical protein